MAIDWAEVKKKAKKKEEEIYKQSTPLDIAPAPVTTTLTGDDIAPPVTTKEDDGKRTFFQKSEYFADGKWDKGDLTKTILGSLTDLSEKVSTGGIGSGEKILDFLTAYGTMQNKQQTMKNAESELLYNFVTGKETDGVYEKHNAYQKLAEKEASDFIAKDLYDESAIAKKIISAPVKEKTGVDSETASVFAEKSDELAIAAGEMVTTKLIGTILGGPAGLLMTGGTSGGSEIEEALKQGATFDEAVTSGIVTAAASMGSGALFNGVKFGGETLTGGAIQKVASAVSSKTLQTLTKWGINTVGEGAEEVIEDAMASIGQKLTYLDEKEFNEIFNSETAWESFLAGIILGGMFEGVDIGVNKIKGTDYVTGSTKSEQNTLNKLVEEKVAEKTKEQAIEKAINEEISRREKEQGGKLTEENKKALRESYMAKIESGEVELSSEELSKKDIAKIEKEIKASLDDGNVDISKIEEILTPDETKQINELEESLNNAKDEQGKAEIEGKIKQLEKTRAENLKKYARENKYLMKAAYEKEMANESYADDSKVTDDYEKAVVESAKKYANNTTVTRKYVDVVRKLAKDRQTRYIFTNNQALLEQGDLVARDDITPEEQAKIKSLEGQLSKATTKEAKAKVQAQLLALKYYDTGGLVRKNDNGVETVLINVDSVQSKYSVVGHETKHTLEKYALNKEFNKILFEYAKSKGDLDTVKNRIADIYKNQENVDIDGEVAAELTGKYLFEDEKFLETLMKNKSDSKVQQVIDKIKELIDDLVIRFKGTEQEKQLREVQKKFTELYNSTEADIVGETTEGTQYAIDNNQNLVYNDSRGERYVRTDEFRNLQAESQRMSYEDTQAYWSGSRKIDDEVRGRLSRTFGLELRPTNSKRGLSVRTLLNPKTNNTVNIVEGVDASLFHDVFEISRKYLRNGELVDLHDVETTEDHGIGYKYCDNYLSEDGLSGFSITPDGDLISVFNLNTERGFLKTIAPIVKEKAKTLDCYASPNQNLMVMYEKIFGFKTASIMDYNMEFDHDNIAKNHEEPKVAFMVNTENDVEVKNFTKEKYDEAVEYRNSFINQAGSNESAFSNAEKTKYSLGLEDIKTKYKDKTDYLFLHERNDSIAISNMVVKEEYRNQGIGTQILNDVIDYADEKGKTITLTPTTEFGTQNKLKKWYKANGFVENKGRNADLRLSDTMYRLPKNNTKYSLSLSDSNGRELSTEQQDFFRLAKTRDEEGRLKPFYHGTGRADRVGNVFDPERATSGPMAYFTDNKEIADNYARDKKDTSIAYDSDYDSYETQFRVNRNGKDMSIVDLWNTLSMSERNAIKEKAKHITMDDDWENVIYSEDEQYGLGNFDAYELNAHRGNALHTLIDSWLTDGNIYGEEHKFLDVLKLVGIEDAKYMNPDFRDEKTYQVYLNITNPFDTSNISTEMLDALRKAAENTEFVEGNSADLWDKRNISPEQWIERLEDDIENGTTHTWTSIPDFVTDTLKAHGYDGIFDTGGKRGGESHTVAIPFYSEQIKNVDNLKPTTSNDIRYSLAKQGENVDYNKSLRSIRYNPMDDLPIRDDIAKKPISDLGDDLPIRSDIAPPVKPPKKEEKGEAEQPIAKILTKEPEVKKKSQLWSKIKTNFIDKASPFESLALKTGNREVDAKFNSIRYSDTKAQLLIGEGADGVKALNDIFAQVGDEKQLNRFYNYLYHKHNVDRMSLESREAPNFARLSDEISKLELDMLGENQLHAISKEPITKNTSKKRAELITTVREYLKSKGVKNKPVFGKSVTAEMSQRAVEQYEAENPEFIEYANDVYNYNKHLLKELINGGVISQETADLFGDIYPHYVPIRREGYGGLNINVPLDSRKTGVNTPIKRAIGGSRNILPLAETMAQRTLQTYKAVAKNRFGIELKNTLGTTIESTKTDFDEVIESLDTQDELLQKGKNGENPTFTVFENGKRVTFEITDEMYDAMKPTSEGLAYTNKVLNKGTNIFRGLVTEFNPAFMLTNPIKDAQDVLLNSQHPVKTYKNFPKAIKELASKGKWYTEYMQNGGADNTYFDKQTNTFNKEKSVLSKVIGIPLEAISVGNNFIERIPRLAEYIASRESGRSIDVSMLDAARVTTNFAAGGDVTKFLNRNGATFLNASVQGAVQQVRNVQEAKANGLKGWVQLATKVALAGLPAVFLNGLLWDDDEDYEELSDYVKQNYYVVAKTQNGKFVRIPKGRALAVIQEAFTQVQNALTGDDEVNLQSFLDLAISNLAPNNPIDNNIIAPIIQVKSNETWYGEDLVPTRLQDVPDAEQYDESTDAISKWLGEKLNYSPYKINYLLNQYSGGVGDMLLPMLTPEAESGNNSLWGNFTAPIKDKFSTDNVFNNQNTTDFYNVSDELMINANSINATDEDVLKHKYFNSISTEISELYKAKREMQNSSLSDDVKYKQVRDIQEQINEITENALNTYENVNIQGKYANIGDRHYRLNDDGEWQKITDEQLEKQNEVTSGLGITPSEYWSNKTEYDYAYTKPKKYAVSQAVGGYDAYKTYSSKLYDIKADKDSNGNSITGSRKKKVIDYINGLDIEFGAKCILLKSQYPSEDSYNKDIVDYLLGMDGLTTEEKKTILEELGATIDDEGYISW